MEKDIEYLKAWSATHQNENEHIRVAVWNAIDALKKQIPKKPSVEGDGESDGQIVYDTWICPCCDKRYEIDYDVYDYCPNCGQHIDRSDLE